MTWVQTVFVASNWIYPWLIACKCSWLSESAQHCGSMSCGNLIFLSAVPKGCTWFWFARADLYGRLFGMPALVGKFRGGVSFSPFEMLHSRISPREASLGTVHLSVSASTYITHRLLIVSVRQIHATSGHPDGSIADSCCWKEREHGHGIVAAALAFNAADCHPSAPLPRCRRHRLMEHWRMHRTHFLFLSLCVTTHCFEDMPPARCACAMETHAGTHAVSQQRSLINEMVRSLL